MLAAAKAAANCTRRPAVDGNAANVGGLTVTGTGGIKDNTQILKAGLNYRFNVF